MQNPRLKFIMPLLFMGILLSFTACKEATTEAPPKDQAHHGLHPEFMDTTVSPTEDFFRYCNGTYIATTEIPGDKSSWGVFYELRENNIIKLHDLLEEAKDATPEAGDIEKLVGNFYYTAMDTASIEANGLDAIAPQLESIENLSSNAELPPLLGDLHSQGIRIGFYIYVDNDEKNSSMNLIGIWQGGLGLPEREYYLDPSEERAQLREQYVAHIQKMLELAGGDPEATAEQAQTIMDLETRMAEASMDRVQSRNSELTYNKMTLEDLQKMAPGFDWAAYFTAIGNGDANEVNIKQPDFIKAFAAMASSVPVEDWKTYLRWQTLSTMAPYLHADFVDENYAFFGKTLNGTEEMEVRWKKSVQNTSDMLGMALGQLYVDKHFGPEAKATTLKMVDNILEVMKERLANLEWMSEDTRQQAIGKLNTILVKLGYPDKWRDYSGLQLGRESYVQNVLATNRFNFRYTMDKAGKPVDRTEWGMSPQTVNAYYNPGNNEIVFPAGILQPPFFDPEVDAALNYGAFGAVIGHELIHAFDDEGSKYDAEGNLNNWWTDSDRENFEARTGLVEDQYNGFTVLDSLSVNGKLTLGENIADIDGLRMAYYAWKKDTEGQTLENEQGFTPEQRFFLAFGQLWCGKMRPEALKMMVVTNPHSPAEFRVKGPVSNLTEFYDAFSVQAGDGMYRPDSLRMQIW